MRFADFLALATGALRGHRLRTALSLTGVAIGVAAVILLTSLGEGARTYVTREFTSLGSNLLIVFPGKTETTGFAPIFGGAPHDLTLDDVEALRRRLPSIVEAAPLTIGRATIRFGSRSRDVVIAGTTPEYHRIRRLEMRIGTPLPERGAEEDRAVCLIGPTIQAELFPDVNPLGQTLRVGDERFRVIGVTVPRGLSLGSDVDDLVTIPIHRQMRMFNTTTLFRVLIEGRSRQDLDALRQAVIVAVKERHSGEEDITVLTQDAMMSSFGNILTLLTSLLAGIGAISLTVAGVGVMNVMLVSVSERTREIGLLKALGATGRQVLLLFLVEATLLSAAGGAAGVLIAWSLTATFSVLYPSFPVQPPVWAVGSALAVSAAVGLGFGSWPARRAAGLDPIVALSKR